MRHGEFLLYLLSFLTVGSKKKVVESSNFEGKNVYSPFLCNCVICVNVYIIYIHIVLLNCSIKRKPQCNKQFCRYLRRRSFVVDFNLTYQFGMSDLDLHVLYTELPSYLKELLKEDSEVCLVYSKVLNHLHFNNTLFTGFTSEKENQLERHRNCL